MPAVQPIPDTYAPQSLMGALLIESMQPWITLHLAWWLDAVGSMFDQVYGLVYDQGTDGTSTYIPGYGALLNPLIASPENLPFLGRFVGVQVLFGQDAATALALVTAEAGLSRGTLGALRSAIQRNIATPWLPSTAYVAGVMFTEGNPAVFYFVNTNYTSGATFGTTDTTHASVVNPASQYSIAERIGSDGSAQAYWVTIRCKPEQLTPTSNSTAITNAINAIIPGGILVGLVVSDSPAWSAATDTWATVTAGTRWGTVAAGQV
jgi:hypothetical protein